MKNTDEEANVYISKMQDIIDWANDDEYYRSPAHSNNEDFNFDTKFIESVLKSVKKYNKISDKQKKCVDNIYNGFKIDNYVEWYMR